MIFSSENISSNYCDTALRHLFDGSINSARQKFTDAVKNSNLPNQELILEIFEIIALNYYKSYKKNYVTQKQNNDTTFKNSRNDYLILIEGMNASGSTAVSEYLFDVENVNTTGNLSMRFLRSAYGLNYLFQVSQFPALFFQGLSIYYTKYILGLSKPGSFIKKPRLERLILPWKSSKRQIDDEREIKIARKYAGTPSFILLLNCFKKFLNTIVQSDNIASGIIKALPGYVRSVLIYYCIKGTLHGPIATRNMLRLGTRNKHLLPYIGDYLYIPCFRDPRSQYVDLFNTNRVKNVYKFITQYRKLRNNFYKDVDEGLIIDKNIISVQFEDFVSSTQYRIDLLDKLFDNYSFCQDKIFNPDVSINNIDKFSKFKNQKDIKLIEHELHEFLWR